MTLADVNTDLIGWIKRREFGFKL